MSGDTVTVAVGGTAAFEPKTCAECGTPLLAKMAEVATVPNKIAWLFCPNLGNCHSAFEQKNPSTTQGAEP